jgi:hypothetical protein
MNEFEKLFIIGVRNIYAIAPHSRAGNYLMYSTLWKLPTLCQRRFG